MGFWGGVGKFLETVVKFTGEVSGTVIDFFSEKKFWTSDDYWVAKGQKIGSYFQWGGGSTRDVRFSRAQQTYLNRATEINQKYNLNLSKSNLIKSAERYAEARDIIRYGEDGGFIGTQPTETVLRNLKFHLESKYKKDEATLKQIELNLEYEKIHNENKKRAQSEALTQILMKNPFAIFANGALYKKGAPGSKTYDPLTVWEPYKYITGDIKEDEYNDILQNRSHYKLAGNKDYFAHVWDEPDWQMPDRNKLRRFQLQNYKNRIKQITQGLKELNNLGWFSDDDKGAYEREVYSLEEIQNREIENIKEKQEVTNSKISTYSGF